VLPDVTLAAVVVIAAVGVIDPPPPPSGGVFPDLGEFAAILDDIISVWK
jgi:hypothetical protein